MNENPLEQGCLLVPDFVHPCELLHNKSLSLAKKRALLCFWASDACAVESRPGFRWLPGTPGPILFDHVRQALQALDDEAGADWSGEGQSADDGQAMENRAIA